MTIQTINTVIARAKAGTPNSPIAVFWCGRDDRVDCVFECTIATRLRIKNKDITYIGSFDNTMPSNYIREKVENGIKEKKVLAMSLTLAGRRI